MTPALDRMSTIPILRVFTIKAGIIISKMN